MNEEQFEEYIENETEIAVLNSGDVFTKDEIPMFSEKFEWEENDDFCIWMTCAPPFVYAVFKTRDTVQIPLSQGAFYNMVSDE